MIDLSFKIRDATFKNPVWVASGTFGYGIEHSPYMDISKLGGICTKGLSLLPRAGNPPPRIIETSAGMLNAIGLENVGVEAFIAKKLPKLRQLQATAIANIYGTSEEEYVELAERLSGEPGLSGIELNISCPNVKMGGMAFGVDAAMAGELTKKVRAVTNLPLMVKLSPNVADVVKIAQAVEAAGADALTAINTLVGRAIDIKNRKMQLANGIGGLSGPAIKPIGIRVVYDVAKAVKIPVIGIGGITTTDDVLEYFMAGATAIQVGTANFIDHAVSEKILSELPAALKNLGVKSPRELGVN